MGLPQTIPYYTPEEYLNLEYDAQERHQYYRGEIFAMAGGSPDHSLIISNVNREIGNRLKGKPRRVYDSNLRIRVPRTTLYSYGDVTVVCGELQFDPIDTRKQTVLNPSLIVEVLSPGTEGWDRGGKFESYQVIDSLNEYVLVSARTARLESYLRQPDGRWLYTPYSGVEAVARLNSLSIDLHLADVYAGGEFPPPASDTTG
jgi:Uma2 family endonuclease